MAKIKGIGTSISAGVFNQLEARRRIVGKTAGRTNDDLQYLTSKTGWVRLSSGVNTLTDGEVAQLVENRGRLTIKGSPFLAGYNILQGGILAPDRSLRKGISTGGASDTAAYANNTRSTGIRPMPGITSVSIQSKNTFGTLREAEVKIVAWSLEDFEKIEKLYLRPGFIMLLEWGHSLYVRNDGSIEKDSIKAFPNSFFRDGINMNTIGITIDKLRKESDYNYDAMAGYVKNFSWSYQPNGSYECTVSIISAGEILESLKLRVNPEHRGIAKSEFPVPGEDTKSVKKTPFHYFNYYMKNDVAGSPFFTKDQIGAMPTFLSKMEPFFGFFQQIDYKDSGAFFFDETVPTHWLPLRVYLDIFNKFILPVDLTKGSTSPDYRTVKFNTKISASNKFLSHLEHFSIDPTVCALLLAHPSPGLGKINCISDNIGSVPAGSGDYNDVLNILVSLPYVIGLLDTSLAEPIESQKSVIDIVNEILANINTALGGINDLQLTFDEEYEGGTYFVVDRNNTDVEEAVVELSLAGVDSIYTDINVSSRISNEMASQISIAAQGSTQNSSTNIENILKWNPGLVDRIIPTKGVSETNKEGDQAVQEDFSEKMQEYAQDVVDFFAAFNGTGWKDEQKEAAKTFHAEAMVYCLKQSRHALTLPSPTPIPVELSFTLDGVGGLKIGEAFKIKQGILPSTYQGRFGYIITGLEHSIENNKWTTTVTTQFYDVEKSKPLGATPTNWSTFKIGPRGVNGNSPSIFEQEQKKRFANASTTKGGSTRVIEGVTYKNGELPEDKLRYINNWKVYKGSVQSDNGRLRLYPAASRAVDKLLEAAEANTENGKPKPIKFKVNSCYRTFSDQQRVFDQMGPGLAAKPGRSNHGFGLAIDFAYGSGAKLTPSTPQYKWLEQNAATYGFKRLPWNPKHPESWEAWHWEYQI